MLLRSYTACCQLRARMTEPGVPQIMVLEVLKVLCAWWNNILTLPGVSLDIFDCRYQQAVLPRPGKYK